MAESETPLRSVSLGAHFEMAEGTVLLSGIQALVRLFLTQRHLDTARGLSTGLFISGYEGSPLGGLDQQLMRSHTLLEQNGIVFTPGVNEELAATAVGGTQLIGELPGRRVDGVTGFWYGKNPGLDRAADAIRHASMSGTNPLGGAVALVGDDPQSKSSTLPSSCELMARSLNTPLFAPASVGDIVPLGLHAVALSRFAGVWSMLKILSDLADATATVDFPALDQLGIPRPDRSRLWRPPDMLGPATVALEENLLGVRIPRIHQYVDEVGLNRAIVAPKDARLAVIASGLGYAAARRALSELGFSTQDLERYGIRIVKIDLPWPLSYAALRAMVDGVSAVLVVEDKAPLIEDQLKSALYANHHQPAVSGKETATGEPLLPPFGAMTSDVVTRALAKMLSDFDLPEGVAQQVARPTTNSSAWASAATSWLPWTTRGGATRSA
jgi:indolepyruvate ferredoxin oxidoreductase